MYFTNILLVLSLVLASNRCNSLKDRLRLEYQWIQLEYDYRSEEERAQAIKNGTFAELTQQPIDVQVYYDSSDKARRKVFVTSPRVASKGTPATLGIVLDKKRNGNPIIKPYPNWEWNSEPEKCKERRLVSVYRVHIDECDRLWVIDNGRNGDDEQTCSPQILLFNLTTDELIHKYEVPYDQHRNKSLYITIVTEIEDPKSGCHNAFAYNSDSDAFSLLVYDYKNGKSWRVLDKSFYPSPDYGTVNVAGIRFELMDGIFALALTPSGLEKKLYYHALSSQKENWVYTKYLKNSSLFSGNLGPAEIFNVIPGGRRDQSAADAMDKKGNLYFGLLSHVELVRWNPRTEYSLRNFKIIGNNKETQQFPSGVKITPDENGDEVLWVFSTAYPKVTTNRLSKTEPNFRIFSAKIKDL